MIRAVLFDLDETLLDIDLSAYLRLFASQRLRLLSQIARRGALSLALPYALSTTAMIGRRDDELANGTFFARRFEELTAIPLDDPVIADCIDCFDREVLNPLAATRVRHAPRRGARQAIEAALALGLDVALATNPTFPLRCTQERMRWAGVEDVAFKTVTSLEGSTRTKPWARYYEQVCDQIGRAPAECVMVGNDPRYDFVPEQLGIPTLYVGSRPDRRALWSGDMEDLAAALPGIVDTLNCQDVPESDAPKA